MCEFRPCIDLHNGKVKQIVGSTLTDASNDADTNFISEKEAFEFAKLYKKDNLLGGHVIKLGPGNDEAALKALKEYPNGLQIGGGINIENAQYYLDAGASKVIVTSFLFSGTKLDISKLKLLSEKVGKERLVIDLSCRKKENSNDFYVVMNRWQTFTDFKVSEESLSELSQYCSEFLVHGVDVEGKRCGIIEDLISFLSTATIPVTYAGGVRNLEDMNRVKALGKNKVNVSVGSALSLFGGTLDYSSVVAWHKENQP